MEVEGRFGLGDDVARAGSSGCSEERSSEGNHISVCY